MGKLLYIKSSPKGNNSNTNKISDKFVEEYKLLNPNDEIEVLDLYEENLGFVTTHDLDSVFGSKDEKPREHPILKYAYQFLEADKYVFSTPMWNLGFPAVLKAYIDYITIYGITFTYIGDDSLGLCKNKKALHFTSRGGDYSTKRNAPFEMGDRYLKALLEFLGVIDYTTIAADGVDLIDNDKDKVIDDTIMEGLKLVKEF